MNRLLIQFTNDNPFQEQLKEYGVYSTFNQAVDAAIPLISDHSIEFILINDGSQWVRIK
jgi:hypothetical protein